MIKQGEIFGEMSFISGIVSSASVITDSACSVLALDRAKLELLLFNEPRIAAALYRFIAKNLRNRILENQHSRSKQNSSSDKVEISNNNLHLDSDVASFVNSNEQVATNNENEIQNDCQ